MCSSDLDVLASEIADDALLNVAILTNSLDEIDVGVGADALFPDEHEASIRISADTSTHTADMDR